MYWKRKKLIADVERTEGFSVQDREGIDLILTLRNGKKINIDVKSYFHPHTLLECKQRNVELFFIYPFENEEVAKEKMLEMILKWYFKGIEPYYIRRTIDSILPKKEKSFAKKFLQNLFNFLIRKNTETLP